MLIHTLYVSWQKKNITNYNYKGILLVYIFTYIYLKQHSLQNLHMNQFYICSQQKIMSFGFVCFILLLVFFKLIPTDLEPNGTIPEVLHGFEQQSFL